jgi:hypothetical protein
MLLDPVGFAAQRANLLSRSDRLFDSTDAGSGRVLRLLVGDRGTSFRPAAAHRPGQAAAAIADALAAAGDADGHSDLRGLRRVARLVRSYRGCIAVRTGDRSAGLRFENGTERIVADTQDRAWTPGSLFETAIFTDQPSPATLSHWQPPATAHREPRLRWAGCTLDPVSGLSEADRASIEAGIAQAVGEPDTLGLVVTVSAGRDASAAIAGNLQVALRHALEALSGYAHECAMAVVFPDTSRHLLDLHVKELYSEPGPAAAQGSNSPRPLLVFGSFGQPLWYGGPAALRAVLTALDEANEVAPVAQARKHWLDAGGEGDGFEAAIREERQLFRIEGDGLRLCLSPRIVIRSLLDTAQQVLAAEVADGGAGTTLGVFRTPTLRITDRWIDIAQLIDGTIGAGFAAFALARAAEQELLSAPSADSLTVGQAATCPPSLTGKLSACLALDGSFIAMASELDQDGWPATGEVPDNARVVLCADLISTENTVRRAAAAIARHADPAVIVCVVDARPEHGPIKVLNREIPVLALARIDIKPDLVDGPPSQITDIDPIMHRPVPRRTAEPPAMDEDALFELCAPQSAGQSSALRLGHFDRPRRMHFSANIDLGRLFRRDDARERVSEAMMAAVLEALGELDRVHGPIQGEDAIAIWYPGSSSNNARTLAWEVQRRLDAAGLPAAPPLAADRAVAGTVWQTLPVAPLAPDSSAPAKRVLIIDSGTLSGATTTQLIQHAARNGAERIAAVILLNQFPHHDTGMLGIVGAVHRGDDRTPHAAAAIPTEVRFVIDSSIGGLDALDCPICASRNKYADLGRAPLRLREHAEQLRELLKPRSWEKIFQTTSVDLFNVPIAPVDAADYLRWRGLLLRALRQTESRQTVLDLMTGLTQRTATGNRFTRRGLIRLLAAEQHWLKLPPLRFAACRARLAAICVDELGLSAPEPPWLRVQAVVVLSITDPQEFAERLPSLLGSIADEPAVVNQLLLECYRLVRRPSHDSPVDPETLRNSLIRCRDYLEQTQTGWDHELIEDLFHVVRQLISLAEQSRLPRTASAQAAWAGLREDWCRWVQRHHFENGMLRVRSFVEDLENAEPDRELARDAKDDWETCSRQVQERALTFLPELREVLMGQHVGEMFGPRDQKLLVELTRTNTTGLITTTERLYELVRAPWAPGSADWTALRDDVQYRIDWWHQMFFAAHRLDSESPALLVDLLQSAPASLAQALDLATAEFGREAVVERPSDLDLLVFCPAVLLNAAVAHVFANARRHRCTPEPQRFKVSAQRYGADDIQFGIANSGSAPRGTPGKGLAELDRSLRSFGGSLTAGTRSGDEWSFEAVITLQTWQGA